MKSSSRHVHDWQPPGKRRQRCSICLARCVRNESGKIIAYAVDGMVDRELAKLLGVWA